ncbi:MAG: hypothetical protein GEV13_31460 [Rhodospirillales bacterium]|nr:hypothetical protein [Rhodospirillales bacterium]
MSLQLARQIDAQRFEAEALAFRGGLHRLAGRGAEALADLDEALAISRQTGMAYKGPWYLGILAVAAEDEATRNNALAEGEALLATNSIAHNHLNFRREAIDACLAGGDWTGAIRHAAALEDLTRHEPLPWATFFVARGRALAAYGQGKRDEALAAELERLKSEGNRFGFRIALPAIAAARREDNGKLIFIGVYARDIIPSELPAAMLLSLAVWIDAPAAIPIASLGLQVLLDEEKIAEGEAQACIQSGVSITMFPKIPVGLARAGNLVFKMRIGDRQWETVSTLAVKPSTTLALPTQAAAR